MDLATTNYEKYVRSRAPFSPPLVLKVKISSTGKNLTVDENMTKPVAVKTKTMLVEHFFILSINLLITNVIC